MTDKLPDALQGQVDMIRTTLRSARNAGDPKINGRNFGAHLQNTLAWLEEDDAIKGAADDLREQAVTYFQYNDRHRFYGSDAEKAEIERLLGEAEDALDRFADALRHYRPNMNGKIVGL